MSLLQVKDLTRTFGAIKAVDGISFSIEAGDSVGLIGANGAGKTTAMRILTTLDIPESGSILFDGMDAVAYPEKVRSRIGWMPDFLDPIGRTTVQEYVDFYARSYGMKGRKRLDEVARVLDFCHITELKDRFINKLSKGQTQRVNMARMLIGDPELLIMDEPAAGLDPKARIEFKTMVRDLQAMGKTMLISSHILSELAAMCDSMIFMDEGHIIRQGSQDSLVQGTAPAGLPIHLSVEGDPAPLAAWLAKREGWDKVSTNDKNGVQGTFNGESSSLHTELAAAVAAFPVTEFYRHERNLEEAFVDILAK